ncbi:MAG: PspC domain-containing protein [Coriobacteriales bacterium]|jgi:phage shock protein C|nr:PspC domain-containing protein [Coriobacteriales bacterium]
MNATTNANRRLYRSDDAVFAGVCGGVAEYFELDPTLIRILAVILTLAGFGLPVVVYLVAMVLMPKHSGAAYIDVDASPSAQPTGATTAAPPGCAYTSCNPRAYDAVGSPGPDGGEEGEGAGSAKGAAAQERTRSRLNTGLTLGILLVGGGILALVATFLDLSAWRFWPVIVILLGLVVLCTPARQGWSLGRAGHAIALITLGFALQLWMFGLVAFSTFLLTFRYLWPVLLVILGLSLISSATGKSVFGLIGSLVFSAALLFGMWNFGHFTEPFYLPLPGGRAIEVVVPQPDVVPMDDDALIWGDQDWSFGDGAVP